MQTAEYRSHAQVKPPGAIPEDVFIDYFSGIMDNMAFAATNDKTVLEQIVSNATT